MYRIDLEETVRRITFPDSVWEWLDLLSHLLVLTQQEALYQDEIFVAENNFERLLVIALNKEITNINAIYALLRFEYIHQAAAQTRLLCEGIITLKYIALDPDVRVTAFMDYGQVEAYEAAAAFLDWERDTAHPYHVESLEKFQRELESEYERVKPKYVFKTRKGKERAFSNWCNKSISQQAKECGSHFEKLYHLVYKQMSAYVHGSGWSLRRQLAYSRKHYKPDVVLNDIANITRVTILLWNELAKFCHEQLEWRLVQEAPQVLKRLEALEATHFPVPKDSLENN